MVCMSQPQPSLRAPAAASHRAAGLGGRPFSPRPRSLGSNPTAGPARVSTRAAFLSLPDADAAGPRVRRLLPSHANVGYLSLFTTESNPPPYLSPSLFRASPGYINRVPHPSAPSCTKAEDRHRPEEATLEP
jgi:hypothetical protein